MNKLAQLSVDEKHIHYATATDFCEIFTEEMHSLYLLSFLLTANKFSATEPGRRPHCLRELLEEVVQETLSTAVGLAECVRQCRNAVEN